MTEAAHQAIAELLRQGNAHAFNASEERAVRFHERLKTRRPALLQKFADAARARSLPAARSGA